MFLIYDNAIVGTATQAENLPEGFIALEGPNLPIEEVYLDGSDIKAKPPKPSEAHYWDGELLEWKIFHHDVTSFPDWDKLISLLHNSPEWARAYAAAERTLKANTAYTTLLTTLSSFRRLENLEFAIAKLREAMSGIAGIGDFTSEEITSINQKLTDCGFDLQLSEAL
ncbi:hypothetical protein I8748_31880 [Nostoc sp. CENA67]|uniref:Uncharacterized protein n=1 Tax=Amazonocrinis nigriterrae CENA67 TaxID=2794033 RepID=A0A8J7I1Q5_9NOST|nr:hypothetical protein [Amazonocrinis nigriterrae]MBH8566699.1 hypothetical protein [Amazonocrinis nigriterrae CENA67]